MKKLHGQRSVTVSIFFKSCGHGQSRSPCWRSTGGHGQHFFLSHTVTVSHGLSVDGQGTVTVTILQTVLTSGTYYIVLFFVYSVQYT